MTLDPRTIRLERPATATIAAAQTYLKRGPRKAEIDAIIFIRELWRLAERVGLDPAVLLMQAWHETAGFTSKLWANKLNPAGIKTANGKSYAKYQNGVDAARALVVHTQLYVDGNKTGIGTYRYLDPRIEAVRKAGWFNTVTHLADYDGKWAEDQQYSEKIAAHLAAFYAVIEPANNVPVKDGVLPGLPPVIWRPTQNWHFRGGVKPIFLVHHITDDMSVENVIGWFLNRGSNASSHFVIARNGQVTQMVGLANAAWTNGDVRSPRQDIPALTRAAINSTVNFNTYCVTVEYVGTPDTPPTEAQYQSGIAIAKHVTDPDGLAIPPHRYGQLRHADINSVTRRFCPGPDFDLERLIAACGGDPEKLAA